MDNTMNEIAKLDALIKESTSILLVAHWGADPDAVASLIGMKYILEEQYGKKKVVALSESIPAALSFIPGSKTVTRGSILTTLQKDSFDLIVVLDFNQWHMASKENAEEIKQFIAKAGIPLVLIDHHPKADANIESDIYINVDPMSTSSNLQKIFNETLGLPILPHVADAFLFGIVCDTNRFKNAYGAPSQAPILRTTADLLDKSTISLAEVANIVGRMEIATLQVVGVLLSHLTTINKDAVYTYIDAADVETHHLDRTKMGDAALYIASDVISTVDQAQWGFIVYPYFMQENTYTIRFRASNPEFPVNKYATVLGGGGHPQSAAARIQAASITEAVTKVLAVVQGTVNAEV